MTLAAAEARFMARALELAEHARGLTSPNPMVGAVLVDGAGAIVGEGFHRHAGAPHAEVEALRVAGDRAKGATLYVTLEPCVHQGRTPPCAPAVLAGGVARVIVALDDPNPLVAGRGLEALRTAGVAVEVGLLAEAAAQQNRVFLTAMRSGRPHVTLKAGMSLDGKLADRSGASKWITGDAARAHAHRLRREADAIVVGVGTVLADDPALTVRLGRPWPREPYRVVLDTAARTPPSARAVAAGTAARALIAVGPHADRARVGRLQASGATVVTLPTAGGGIDLDRLLAELFARDVRGVLVEGGSRVHGAFVDAGLVDRVAIFVAPRILGGHTAPVAIAGIGRDLGAAISLGPLGVTRVGDDLLIEADVLKAR